MNDEHIEKLLASLDDVHAPKHRTALRAALMREHARIRRPYFTFSALTRYITMQKALIPVSTFAVLTLIVVGTLGFTHKSAEAQELVQRSMAAAARLAPEMRAEIEANIKADMMKTLEEAYKAPDLRILTAAEYEKESQFTISTSSGMMTARFGDSVPSVKGQAPVAVAFASAHAGAQGDGVPAGEPIGYKATGAVVGEENHDVFFNKATADGKFTTGTMVGAIKLNPPVKYLRYTDPDGRKVTLGLDDKDTPVFLIEEFTSHDMVPGPDGSVGIQGKVLHQIQVHTENPDGGYSTAGSIHVESDEMGASQQ